MKIDPYLTPQLRGNLYPTNVSTFAFAPNIPSGSHPYMADYAFSTNVTGQGTVDDNPVNANNFTTWHNYNSFVYKGTITIPQTRIPTGISPSSRTSTTTRPCSSTGPRFQ